MLKILRIKADGYKLLEDNFEICFFNKTRVYSKDIEKEILDVDKSLYTFRSFAFVGGNSSGKSTILSLILKVNLFLQTGRFEYIPHEFKKDIIKLEIDFYLNGFLYSYSCDLNKIDDIKVSSGNRYCQIENENIKVVKYDKNKGSKCFDELKNGTKYSNNLISNTLFDTSSITILTKNEIIVDEFYTNNIVGFSESIVRNTFFASLNSLDIKLVSSIIKLLDESIEYIISDSKDSVRFKRINEEEIILSNIELITILSSSTFRGVELYIRAINALKLGKPFIVDEIENCFQKNIVYNLLFLFNDSKINSKGAQLFFSTHYIEILDYLSRRDSIFIIHKENGRINAKNLYDYNVRTELLKSKQFDNNVFNTSLNYKQLMEVRRNLLNELHSNND